LGVVKIVEIADIHIGNGHELDSLKVELSWFISYITDYKPDLIVILGDMFDKKLIAGSPPDTLGRWFINELLKLDSIIIYEYGTYQHESTNIDSYSQLLSPKFQIYKLATENYILGMHILHLPEEYEYDKASYYGKLLKKGKTTKYDMVYGHGLLSTVPFLEKLGNNKRTAKIYFNNDDFTDILTGKVVFGHYHVESSVGILTYPGSFSRNSFGEDKPKGFYTREYDISSHSIIKEQFIVNSLAPIYKTVNAKHFNNDNVILDIENAKLGAYRLRIIIDSDINEHKIQSMIAYSYAHSEIIIDKRFRGFKKQDELIKNQETEERRKLRNEMLIKYSDLSFYDVTTKLAEEKYGIKLTIEEIKNLLK
jgi:DNA repair exonuclease SbcCD nuclease subunit